MSASSSSLVALVIGLGLCGSGLWAMMEVAQGSFSLDLVRAFGIAVLIAGVVVAGITWIRRLWS